MEKKKKDDGECIAGKRRKMTEKGLKGFRLVYM